jgi:hypothetical protein
LYERFQFDAPPAYCIGDSIASSFFKFEWLLSGALQPFYFHKNHQLDWLLITQTGHSHFPLADVQEPKCTLLHSQPFGW